MISHSVKAKDSLQTKAVLNIETQEIYVGTVETLSIPSVTKKVIIDNVNLIPKSANNLASKLIFSGAAQRTSSLEDTTVDIQINHISTLSNGPTRELNIGFRNLRIGALTIQSSDNSGSPIKLSISFENNATSNSVSLAGGSYSEIDIKINSEDSAIALSRTIAIDIDDFENIVVAGAAIEKEENRPPVTLHIHAQYAEKPKHSGVPSIELYQLQLLEGSIDISSQFLHKKNDNLISPEINCSDDNRLNTMLRDLTLGDDAYREFKVKFPVQKCMEFSMQSVKGTGKLILEGGILGELTFDGVHSDGLRGLRFSSETAGLNSLKATSVNLETLDIKTHDGLDANLLNIQTWKTVHVEGTVSLPQNIYQKLDQVLREHANKQTAQISGVRRFLAQSAWDSYFSDTQRPASNEALYSLLRSDSKRIYGPVGAKVLEYFTGFGVQLSKPLITFLVYSGIFTMLSVFLGTAPSYISRLVCFLKNVIPGGSPDETDIRVHRLGLTFRFFVLIQVALVSLFIQNAVLVGS